jgi:pyranose oxidase
MQLYNLSAMKQSETDLLIIGSGPAGATFARTIHDLSPRTRITILECGPSLTRIPGMNVRNIAAIAERTVAQVRSQGPDQFPYTNPTVAVRSSAARDATQGVASILARPGTFLLGGENSGMPAASMSSNVGGMGAHWSCACPRPGDTECIPFIDPQALDLAFTRAEALLRVTQSGFAPSDHLLKTLRLLFPPTLTGSRPVQAMPLACRFDEKGEPIWTGSDTILGDLVSSPASVHPNFALLTETLCQRVLHHAGEVTGIIAKDLATGESFHIGCKALVVTADALRTPQLLWNSEIRPPALGRYLNDQPQVICAVKLHPRFVDQSLDARANAPRIGDKTLGVLWVPFHAPSHPFHGQVMHLEASPIPFELNEPSTDPVRVVALGWFCAKEIMCDDRIVFSRTDLDHYGMPKMSIEYRLTATDLAMVERAKIEQLRALEQLGEPLNGQMPEMIPAGSSLHYQGTTRVGTDPETSVCNADSRVWGFENLFVGGNGVIPTSTACNPTLTAVALAVQSCTAVLQTLSR